GQTSGKDFWGSRFAAGPKGEIIAMASDNSPEEFIVEIDKLRTENVRHWWPFLRDRRIDFYNGLTSRFLD
ncbi:MAG: acyltransferase, partial [Muribaculaceae bacterium]|nr:acyltransferase [Muribaculaceae bacterium]